LPQEASDVKASPRSLIPGVLLSRRGVGLVTAVCAVALVATACAAGQIAETAEETPVRDAAGGRVNNMAVQGVAVPAPQRGSYSKGSDVLLQTIIVNYSDQDDQLVSVSSPIAGSVTLAGSSGQYLSGSSGPSVSVSNPLTGSLASSASASISPETTVPSAPGLSPSVPPTTPGGSGSATSSITPTNLQPSPGAGVSSSSSSASLPLKVPHNTSISVGYQPNDPGLILRGINTALYTATPFVVTFTFAKAGSITVSTSVRLQTGSVSPSIVPSLTGSE
jgi:copper(I)-binding protein